MAARAPLAVGAMISASALLAGCSTGPARPSTGTLVPDAARSAVVVSLGAHYDYEDALSHLVRPADTLPMVPPASMNPKQVHTKAKRKVARKVAKVVAPAVSSPVVRAPAVTVPALGSAAYKALILSKINFNWRALDFSIDFVGPRDGYLGLTSAGYTQAPHYRINIYVRPDESLDEVAYIAAYEIGHVIDLTRNTQADRTEWLKLRGNPNAAWFTCNACTEDMVGAGDFSDVFAWYSTNHGYYVSRVAQPPTEQQLGQLTPFFFS